MNRRKEVILQLVKNALANADDNLSRARMAFRAMSNDEMREDHGQSGRSRQEVLSGYSARRDELKDVEVWARTM